MKNVVLLIASTLAIVGAFAAEDEMVDLAAKRRDRLASILAAPNLEPPAGTPCRYLDAEHGDDSADGLTPATAWRSIERLNRKQLAPGTWVLFRRGDLFRGTVWTNPGVTYTAYGEGEKPVVCGSPENGADPSKWQRLENSNIWSYPIGKRDVGTLVFDGGKAHAIKVMVRTDTKTGSKTDLETGRPFNSPRDLEGDLRFWHDYRESGNLYLVSETNPGERFSSIEFNVRVSGFGIGHNADVTIDNIAVRHVGIHGVSAGTCTNLTVRNCTFEWIGGSIQAEGLFGRDHPTRFGNGVEIWGGCEGYVVSNCYFREIYDAGATHQYDISDKEGLQRFDQRKVRYLDNLFERCCYSIEYFLSAKNGNESLMDDVLIQGNLMIDAGYGYCRQRPDKGGAAHIKAWYSPHRNRARNFVVRDNIIRDSHDRLLHICHGQRQTDGSSSMPRFERNLVMGRPGSSFGTVSEKDNKSVPLTAESAEILNQLGEGNRCLLK